MSYKNFDSDDSLMSAEERHSEAVRILKLFIQCEIGEQFSEAERSFITAQFLDSETSWKQLLWLRDIKAKYLE